MSIAIQDKTGSRAGNGVEPRFVEVAVTDDRILATFSDERIVSVPLWWSWRLEQASTAERNNYQIIGAGHTVYWPDVDEHLSVRGFFYGTPAPRPTQKNRTR
jgi:hypothetical protein